MTAESSGLAPYHRRVVLPLEEETQPVFMVSVLYTLRLWYVLSYFNSRTTFTLCDIEVPCPKTQKRFNDLLFSGGPPF